MPETELADPTRIEGMAHPRETPILYGQDAAEREFLGAVAAGRLHSGWMLTGPRGVGKATLAYRIAAFLLALGPAASPAPVALPGTLALPEADPDLRLVRIGAHPRLFVVRRGPNDKGDRVSQDIRAGDVRRLKDFFHLSAADGGRRVVVVDAADEMNPTAANALLKELEEPPRGATLLLVTHQPSRLLPTIRSRCRTLRLGPLPAPDLARALTASGIESDAPEALAVLAAGSVGEAARMAAGGGLSLYEELVVVLEGVPRLDRPAAIRLAESCAGRNAEGRFSLLIDLLTLFLGRAARAGIAGQPANQGAPGEARLLARLSPDIRAARTWAELQAKTSARLRHGRAVNLDPAALVLDTLLAVEDAARAALPA